MGKIRDTTDAIYSAEMRQYGAWPDFDANCVKATAYGEEPEPTEEAKAAIRQRIETLRAMKEATSKPVEAEPWTPPELGFLGQCYEGRSEY